MCVVTEAYITKRTRPQIGHNGYFCIRAADVLTVKLRLYTKEYVFLMCSWSEIKL